MLETIEINNKTFKVALAADKESQYLGLSGQPRLGETKGMLFIFPEPKVITMSMRDMEFPLDFVFIDKNWDIVAIKSADVDDTDPITVAKECQMVLELNKGVCETYHIKSGMNVHPSAELKTQYKGIKKYKEGGVFEMVGDKVYKVKTTDIPIDSSKLQILNSDGEVVANIEPGSRIFSREDTAMLINKFKEGKSLDLADFMIEAIVKQNGNKPDHVTKKK